MSRQNRIRGCVVLGFALVTWGMAARAADHRDSPTVKEDGRTDINDVYVFRSPVNANNTVLVMTVNPFAGVLSPTTFYPSAEYVFNVDTDADAVEDLRLTARF